VAPVTATEVQEMSREGGSIEAELRVLSFQEKRLLQEFSQQDWQNREIAEVYQFLHALKKAPKVEPRGIRAQPLPQDTLWMNRYPLWFAQFTAGKLFVNRQVWEQTFESYQESLPGKIRKWLNEGYSIWLNVKKFCNY
jgi:hypothetical protein